MPPLRLEDLARKIDDRERLTLQEGLQLYAHPNLTEVGALADRFRRRSENGDRATYSVGVRLNWDAADRNPDRVKRLLSALSESGGAEVALTGALPEHWNVQKVQCVLREVRESIPGASVTGLSPGQITRLAQDEGISPVEVLSVLHRNGLAALGPFHFELLAGRSEFTSEDGPDLLGLLQAAREMGLPVTLQVELPPSSGAEDRLNALFQVRDLQALTGGIRTLIPLNTERSRNYTGSAFDYLRSIALARLIVDDIPHVRASWEAHDLKIAQVALEYGADDFGTVWLDLHPNADRPVFSPEIPEVERNIREVGFTPQARNALYETVMTPRTPTDSLSAD